jgi:hypothetical protein
MEIVRYDKNPIIKKEDVPLKLTAFLMRELQNLMINIC